MACTFSTSQLLKVARSWCGLYILTSKCASRHNGVQFFISHLARWLRTRCFSEPTFRPSGATNHWKNTVFCDFPTFLRICVFFFLTLSLLWSSLFYSSLLSDSSHLCFSSVHIVGSLTSKLPSISAINHNCWSYYITILAIEPRGLHFVLGLSSGLVWVPLTGTTGHPRCEARSRWQLPGCRVASDINRGFLKCWYPNSWIVYKGKPYYVDDLGVPPWLLKPQCPDRNWSISTRKSWCIPLKKHLFGLSLAPTIPGPSNVPEISVQFKFVI